MRINSKINIEKILDIFMAVMVVLNCQSVYQNAIDKNYRIFELTLFSIICATFIKIINGKIDIKLLNKAIFISVIYMVYLLLFMALSVPKEQFVSFASRYFSFPLIIFYFLFQKNNKDRINFFKYFVQVSCIVSVISLFFWFFGTFLHIIRPTNHFAFLWGSRYLRPSYYNLYFEVQWIDLFSAGDLKRNTAIFVEGPCFTVVLMFSLLFSFIFKNEFRHYRLVQTVLIAAVITTFSVTAYGFLMIILYFEFRNDPRFIRIKPLLYAVLVPVGIVVFAYLLKRKSGSGSYELRSGDIEIIFKGWLLSPVFGSGYGDNDSIAAMVSDRKVLAVASSLGCLLMQGGLMYLMIYMIPIINGFVNCINAKREKYALVAGTYALFLCVILFQTFYLNFFIWVLLLFGNLFENKSTGYNLNNILGRLKK